MRSNILPTLQVDLPELQGATCEEIAIQKCKMAAEHVKGPVMCEDTSLCYHALKGLPGTNLDFVLGDLGGTVAHRVPRQHRFSKKATLDRYLKRKTVPYDL